MVSQTILDKRKKQKAFERFENEKEITVFQFNFDFVKRVKWLLCT